MDILPDLWVEVFVVIVIPEVIVKEARSPHGYFNARADLLDCCGDIIRIEVNVSSNAVGGARDLRKLLIEKFPAQQYLRIKRLSAPTYKTISNVAATFQFNTDIRTSLSSAHISSDPTQVFKGFEPVLKTVYCHYASDVLLRAKLAQNEGKEVVPRSSITGVVLQQVSAAEENRPAIYKVITNNLKCELVSGDFFFLLLLLFMLTVTVYVCS
jgi:hypothetical protein